MTTAAYRKGVLAADRLVTDSGIRCGTGTKLARGIGGIGAAAGSVDACVAFMSWVRDGAKGEAPTTLGEERPNGILIRPDGRVFGWSGTEYLDEIAAPFFAIGSGWQIAMGAMAMGADALCAVEIAAEYDVLTGGGVDVLTLGDAP